MRNGELVSHQDVQPSRFLALPLELRFGILSQLLEHPDGIQVSNFITDRTSYALWCRRLLHPLTLVSHQMRLEAIAIFSSSNSFDVTSGLSLVHLLETLGAIGRQNLIRINFTLPGAINATDARNISLAIPLLAQCEKLKLTVYLYARNLKEPWGHQYTPISHPLGSTRPRPVYVDHVCRTPFAKDLKRLVRMAVKVSWIDENKHRDLVEFRKEAEEWLEVGGAKGRGP
ncbi:hypothetical protein AOQ84DRAFT_372697 [Glonium stellatum]|uniref:F-box domain-containing protein n=1 Tax=Glonium stellatum TaxID=574774 RepID=A0A8E2F9E0_9PEZI|nr:hypothetical protein AOQ84DRAFT_372697 [Glonium stellatum]